MSTLTRWPKWRPWYRSTAVPGQGRLVSAERGESSNILKSPDWPTIERAISDLRLEHGVDWDELAARVASKSGKAIRIQALGDENWTNTTGALSRMSDVDLILVRYTDSALYRTHSILHEFGHILLAHPACPAGGALLGGQSEEQAAERVAYRLAHALYRPRDYDDQQVFG
ncbi:hypothetical protein [Rathayibacter soli]|uniref:hypothetical protein n=1 Tax=Rathayibacter soli TaxID=3144168 RepID=UPI0027E3EB8A|nr:hypothetical protein [Glaciibacter superstes]